MRPSKVVGLSGKKRAGKDTFYQLALPLLTAKGYTVTRVAFADLVKEFAYRYFGVLPDDDKEKIRFILQGIGEMIREEFDENFWITEAFNRANDADIIFVTDMRYENELEWVKTNGGKVIRVTRNQSSDDSHPSEVELDNAEFDYEIYNTGSIDDYMEEVETCLLSINLL